MIRINLIDTGVAKRRPGKVGAEMTVSGAVPSVVWAGVGLLILAVVFLAGHYFYIQGQSQKLARQLLAAQQESVRLQAVRHEYQENTQRKQLLEQRINVINSLKANQQGPSTLLQVLRRSVDGTNGVWLTSVKESPGSLAVAGSALNLDAVANLMTQLEATGYFQQVELKESSQQAAREGANPFTFSLTALSAAAAAAPPATRHRS